MKNKIKIGFGCVALMAFIIGGVPAFGQSTVAEILEDDSSIFPVFGNNLVQLDSLGRLEGVLNLRGGLTTFVFDDSDNLSQRTAADLKVTDYGALNHLVAVTNEGVEVATFDHDASGNILNHEDSKGTKVDFGYDTMNRLVFST